MSCELESYCPLPESSEEEYRKTLFTQILEEAWKKLPTLLGRLPLCKRINYFQEAKNKCRPAICLNLLRVVFNKGNGWKEVLEKLALQRVKEAEKAIPPRRIALTTAKVDIMYEWYWKVLQDLEEIRREPANSPWEEARWNYGEWKPFLIALGGLAFLVPWRYGIPPKSIETSTLQKALNLIQSI